MMPDLLMTDLHEAADIVTSSEEYARRFSGRTGAWFLQVQAQAVLGMLAEHPAAHILDVGGGHNQLAGLLAEKGYRVRIFSSAPLAQTRVESLVRSGRCDFSTGNVLDLPFENCSFDVVTGIRMLSHVGDWPALLGEMTRVAGRAVVFDYTEKGSLNRLAPRLFGLKRQIEKDTRPFQLFRGAELALTLNRLGFQIEQRYPQFLLPMVMHRRLGVQPLSAGLEALFRLTGLTGRWGSPVLAKAVRQEGRRDG